MSALTSLPFTTEELTLCGDAMDTACKALEPTMRDPSVMGREGREVRGRWARFNSMRTMFREAQYGAERTRQEEPQMAQTPSQRVMRWFSHDHLPAGPVRQVSQDVGSLAQAMEDLLPDGPEKTTGLRKLLEAKDCLVRAAIEGVETGQVDS